MLIFGLFFFLIGILFIAMPEMVGYIIGAIFLMISINFFAFAYRIEKFKNHKNQNEKIFSFGNYEFIKRNK